MVFAYVLISLTLLVYGVLDLIRTPASEVRTLPKPLWFLVLLPPIFGPAAWLLAGRPTRGTTRPRTAPAAPPLPPDDDEEFLRELRRRMRDPREE